MGKTTRIGWCRCTFNLWIGCMKISPGCKYCYAERQVARMGKAAWGPVVPRIRTSAEYWRQPLKWDAVARAEGRPWRVFCGSLMDWAEGADVPVLQRDLTIVPALSVLLELGTLIRSTPWLDWLLLTKRPDNAEPLLREMGVLGARNIWLGTSVESRLYLWRIAEICSVPAFRRFVSFEPLLEDLGDEVGDYLSLGVDWAIGGGESGGDDPRRMVEKASGPTEHAGWMAKRWALEAARRLRDRTTGAGKAFYWKQWGGPVHDSGGDLLDGRQWHEFPTTWNREAA